MTSLCERPSSQNKKAFKRMVGIEGGKKAGMPGGKTGRENWAGKQGGKAGRRVWWAALRCCRLPAFRTPSAFPPFALPQPSRLSHSLGLPAFRFSSAFPPFAFPQPSRLSLSLSLPAFRSPSAFPPFALPQPSRLLLFLSVRGCTSSRP